MSRIRKPGAVSFFCQLERLTAAASALYERVEQHGADARDLAMAIEYNQKYVDILDDMLSSKLPITTNGKAFQEIA